LKSAYFLYPSLNSTPALFSQNFASKAQEEYENFIGDVKLWVSQEQLYAYPDGMVVVGDVADYNNRRDIILNPQVIIEVLSKSTEGYDCLGKFAIYRTIPNFVEYVLIHQNRIQIEHFTK